MGARVSRRRFLLAGAALAAALAAAAVGFWPDPPTSGAPDLRSLSSPVESREYGRAYWLEQAAEGGLIWRLALAYCRDPRVSRLPNCRNVIDADRSATVAAQAFDDAAAATPDSAPAAAGPETAP